jgi:hypothetical protein
MYFDYRLVGDAPSPIKLEILDAAGAVLRTIVSAAPGATPPAAQGGMRGGFGAGAPGGRLSTSAGLHRYRWDFSLPGPEGLGGRGLPGPWVAPGAYQVRLTMGERVETKPFRILIDPRLPPDGVTEAVLAEQLAISLKARDLMSESRRFVTRLAELKNRAAALTGTDAEGARRALPKLVGLETRLVTAGGRYPTPKLADQIAFLYGMTLSADQQMGRDVYERYAELTAQLITLRTELDVIVSTDLPGLKAVP